MILEVFSSQNDQKSYDSFVGYSSDLLPYR